MLRRPPTRMPSSASGTYTTAGGLGPVAPVKSPPPPSTSTTRFLGTTAVDSRTFRMRGSGFSVRG
eukprot:CAMPEP_0198685782 /NCGR_PEP_ID=MMETSP1468-20131203/14095_1 /TAXON_ID=1461545 /ORGANISM="Mantoniella sp, Strain CCMP1436" /LENGTH=64 /DNA_ID=CAMNT_0044431471 /DNA_START=149 /DNA_END=340 /DNA_ORIENTATION=-